MIDKSKLPPDKPDVVLEYTSTSTEKLDEFNIRELTGFIEVLTTAPTYKARRFWEQIKLLSNGSLHIYDNEVGAWRILRAPFAGVFNADGSLGSPFPTGWSVNKTGTGTYVITHNLGTTDYAVVATPFGFYNIVQVASQGSNSFELYAVDRASGASSNTAMNFILTLA